MVDSEVHLVLPMAGDGTRFTVAGYTTPKPLLPIHGVPMFAVVLSNLLTDSVSGISVVSRKEWGLSDTVKTLSRRIERPIVLTEVSQTTGGPADTVALTRGQMSEGVAIVTANSDQYVIGDMEHLYSSVTRADVSGCIMTMGDDHPKWSYASIDDSGFVTAVREKEVISPFATVGIYGFHTAAIMWRAFEQMYRAGDRVNGEFYVAPSFNYIIAEGGRVTTMDLGPIRETMFGMGTPEDYESFLADPASREAADKARSLLPF